MKKMNLKKAYNGLNYGLYPNNLPRKKKKQAKNKALIWCKETYHKLFDEYGNVL